MHSLFSTWTGFFYYEDERMPFVESTITFKKTGDNEFRGFVSENLLILPEDVAKPIHMKGQKLLTAWGSVAGKIKEGEIHNRYLPKLGQGISFVKDCDQLSGHLVSCLAGFNSATGLITGRWDIIEGGTRCYLRSNLKKGHFTLRKPDDGGKTSTGTAAPVIPELLPA